MFLRDDNNKKNELSNADNNDAAMPQAEITLSNDPIEEASRSILIFLMQTKHITPDTGEAVVAQKDDDDYQSDNQDTNNDDVAMSWADITVYNGQNEEANTQVDVDIPDVNKHADHDTEEAVGPEKDDDNHQSDNFDCQVTERP